jgi:hypothetical protein
VHAFGTEIGGEFVPIPIMRSRHFVHREDSELHRHYETVAFAKNNNQVLIGGHEVKSTLSNWHYGVPVLHPSVASAAN